MHTKACAVGRTQQAATDDTIAWPTGGDGVTAVHADGGYAGWKISACCFYSICRGFVVQQAVQQDRANLSTDRASAV